MKGPSTARYLRPGGVFVMSGGHPAYSRIAWDGKRYMMAEPYTAEGGVEHTSWKGVPIVIQHRTLGTIITGIARAGLRIEALVEGELNPISRRTFTPILRDGTPSLGRA